MKPRIGPGMSFRLWSHFRRALVLRNNSVVSSCGCHWPNSRAVDTTANVGTFLRCSRNFATAPEPKDSYDLIVIGGGSGGLACAKEAAQYGAKACVLDYVEPSPRGTTWGLGGTCTNVGCIPKKLYHEAALLRQSIDFAAAYGWQVPNAGKRDGIKLDWSHLVTSIQQHVKSINWGYRVQLSSKKVKYINATGTFVGPNLVKARTGKGQETILHGKNIVVAVGGRPNYLGVEGDVEQCITSDDVFSLSENPGKTLVVGGGYIALETAGFLRGFGIDATVMYRSVALREFDQQMANLVVREMELEGVKFLKKCKPLRFKKSSEGLIEAYWTNGDGSTGVDKFKTVMLAVGRRPTTDRLNLEAAGVDYDKKSGKIKSVDGTERTNVSHIYAVGDVMEGRPELTPVASKAGRFLGERLFSGAKDGGPMMNYQAVPTTVFTPLEYSSCGLSEEKAIEDYGEDNVEVFHAFYKPLGYYIPDKNAANCYVKIVCLKEDPQKVIGLHYTGPYAGEIMQGFAVAMEGGLTRKQMERSIGIHPTVAEEFVRMLVTKSSGEDAQMTAC